MNQNEMYLTTGEFAKLCHTTKHTLFHYCDIGLFVPAYTDENGYRYYHALQYDLFMTISQMQATGMTLTEIKAYLEQRSPQRMVELYRQQEQQIARQIAQLKQIKNRMTRQRTQIQQYFSCSEAFFVEQQSSANLLCSRNSVCASDGYPFYFCVEANTAKADHIHVKPAGKYLSTYHHGAYETLEESYQALINEAEQRQILLNDWIYVETILGDWAVCQEQDYVLKVSVGIRESYETEITSNK